MPTKGKTRFMRVLSVVSSFVLLTLLPVTVVAGPTESVPVAPTEPSDFRPYSDPEVVTTPQGYGVFMTGDRPGDAIGYVATGERGVNVRVRMNTIYTDDGYSLRVQVLAHDDDVLLMHFLARGPAGEVAGALVKGWKRSGTVEQTGLDAVRALISRSADFALLGSVAPALAEASLLQNRKIATNSCSGQVAIVIGTTMTALAVCGSVEATGNILGCLGVLVSLSGQLYNLYMSCGVLDVCGDGPCPDGEEPPCTSLTIC
jgi:hypothetical protein